MTARAKSAVVAAAVSPLIIVVAAAVLAAYQWFASRGARFDPNTLYFPDPRKPWEYPLLVAIYALPAAWILMLIVVPLFLRMVRAGLAHWSVALMVGILAGLAVGAVLGTPRYSWLLPEGALFGCLVGVTFWWTERRLFRRWSAKPANSALQPTPTRAT